MSDLQRRLNETENELAVAQAKILELEARLAASPAQETPAESQDRTIGYLVQRLEMLHDLDQAILSANSLEKLTELALNHIIQFIPCNRASISTIDLKTKTIHMLALYTKVDTSFPGQRTYVVDDPYLASIAHKRYFIIDHLDQNAIDGLRVLHQEGIRKILLVPLRVNDTIVGLFNLHSADENDFTETQIQIILEVANQVALGIHKASLTDELAQFAYRMEILHAIDLGLIQGSSIKMLVANTLKQLQRIIPCERIGVGVIEPSMKAIIIYSSQFNYDSELSEGTRIPLQPNQFDKFDSNGIRLVRDMHLEDDPPFKQLVKEGFQSHLQVLLRAESGNVGMMGLSSTVLDFFTPQHQQIAMEIASQLSIVLHQLQLSQALEQYAAELEQRVAERTVELQTSKEQIEAILQNSLDGILLIDRDLKIQQANPAVSRLLSVELDKHETVNLLDLLPPGDASRVRQSIEDAMTEQNAVPVEVQATRQNGARVEMEFSFGYIPGDGLVSTIHDITARKQAEAALKQALVQEKELVEARSRFVSVTSHEFRTPLSIILTTTDMLLNYRDRLTIANIDLKLETIRQNVLHMRSIMDDVLQLVKMQSEGLEFKPQYENFTELCHSMIEELENIPEAKGRLKYAGSVSPLHFVFDQRLMKLAVNNLISNAIKYSPVDKPVEITLLEESGQVNLSIRDYGIGIPDNDLKRLFEPFHRASNVGDIQGTGLGLSITKQIIDRHDGSIQVESSLGMGTTFTIVIPMLQSASS